MRNRILLIDDEQGVLNALQRVLSEGEYEIHCSSSAAEALELMQKHRFKVVISDERMPGMAGSEFLTLASLRAPETVRIMLTGHASIAGAMRAVNEGQIYRFMTKPWDDDEVRLVVAAAIEKYDLEMTNRRLLALVRCQAFKLRRAEERQPGITALEHPPEGYSLPELSDDELARLLDALDVERVPPRH